MFARLVIIAVLLIVSSGNLLAKDSHTDARVGDLVVVEMSGDLAKEYAMRTGMPKQGILDARRVSISTMASIVQYRADGKYRIVCQGCTESGCLMIDPAKHCITE